MNLSQMAQIRCGRIIVQNQGPDLLQAHEEHPGTSCLREKIVVDT